jgi:hypothetical protein
MSIISSSFPWNNLTNTDALATLSLSPWMTELKSINAALNQQSLAKVEDQVESPEQSSRELRVDYYKLPPTDSILTSLYDT